jgi:RNA polymerase II subunit A small phosphatase-like protein
VVDDSGSFERSSKNSVTGKKREGSRASSRRSRRAQAGQGNTVEPMPAHPEMQDGTKTERKKGGFFSSLLSCCSPSENVDSLNNGDPTLPPKKTAKVQANRGRQPVAVEKQEPSAAESGTSESKDHYDEKVGLRPDLEQEPATVDQLPPNEVRGQAPMAEMGREYGNASPMNGTNSKLMVERTASEERTALSPALPIPSSANETIVAQADQHPDVKVEAPTPTVDQPDEQATSDRTPQQVQRDSDVPMPDAPPAEEEEADEEPVEQTREEEAVPPRPDLPPPPPRDSYAGLAGPPLPGPPEKHQGLLPPIQPQFMGKKCLVLDLDETLVHSSFKVRT